MQSLMQPYPHCCSFCSKTGPRVSLPLLFWPPATNHLCGLATSLRTQGLHNRLPDFSQAPIAISQCAYRSKTAAAAAAKHHPGSSSGSVSSPLQAIEMAAIAVAAACQAFVLIKAAMHLFQAQLAGMQAPHQYTQQQQQHYISISPSWQQHQQPSHINIAGSSSSVLGSVQSLALVIALMCGAALRSLQQGVRLSPGSPAADAAARLVALEVATQQQAATLTTTSKQMDKLQARVRIATSDLKAPIRQVQGTTGQAAAAISKLSEQQQRLRQQLEDSQELIGALQALAAKQFKVSAEALQQLKQSQSQLSTKVAQHLQEAVQQQQQLLLQVDKQQEKLHVLEQQMFLQKRQQLMQELQGLPGECVDEDRRNSSTMLEAPPDPWSKNGCTSSFYSKEQHVGERSSSSSSKSDSSSNSSEGNGRGSLNAASARVV